MSEQGRGDIFDQYPKEVILKDYNLSSFSSIPVAVMNNILRALV